MDRLTISVNDVLARMVPLIAQDAELLATLREAAAQFIRLTALPAEASEQPIEVSVSLVEPIPEPQSPALPTVAAQSQHVPLPSAPGIEIPATWYRRLVTGDCDLQLIENRCRLKAEGSRWAASRQQRIGNGAHYYTEIEPSDLEIIEKAKGLNDCFLWMNHSSTPIPGDLRLWEDVAGCFDAQAMAVALLRQIIEGGEEYREFLEKVMDLTSEAQSALRMAVDTVNAKPDNDQQMVYHWLRRAALDQQIFIQRFMRLDDPADPREWNGLQERIGRLEAEIEETRTRKKQRVRLLKKGQYHARLIYQGKGGAPDWQKVIEAINTLVVEGVPPSNTDFRDMLVPIVDDIPESIDLPEGFRKVMVEIDRFLSMQVPPVPQAIREQPEDVRKVAAIYEGKTLVLIGGDSSPHAHEALKSAFRLKELIWVPTREHESTDLFVPYIARPDTDAVLLAIRWSSHSYGEVRAIYAHHGKEFFRLPAGYNPSQVAHQILRQRGEK